MIISHGRKYVFVHIPKTGGTSMALALEARAMKDDIMLGDTPKAAKRRRRLKDVQTQGRLWKHSTLADIDGLVSPDALADMFCLTMVRNPWDRMVSYYHWLRGQGFDHPAVTLAKAVAFDEFLSDQTVQNSLRDWPAARYMTDATGRIHCHGYIRLEHFKQDAAPLEKHLGFEISLPQVNESNRQGRYQDFYTPRLQQIVASCCADDIVRFGYTFDA